MPLHKVSFPELAKNLFVNKPYKDLQVCEKFLFVLRNTIFKQGNNVKYTSDEVSLSDPKILILDLRNRKLQA